MSRLSNYWNFHSSGAQQLRHKIASEAMAGIILADGRDLIAGDKILKDNLPFEIVEFTGETLAGRAAKMSNGEVWIIQNQQRYKAQRETEGR